MTDPKIQPSSDAEWRAFYEEKCREQRKEIAALTPGFNELVNRAAGDLPPGWEIVLRVENGYGGVELFDPDGTEVVMARDEQRIEDAFEEAIKVARGEI